MKNFKNYRILFVALFAVSLTTSAQVDRSKMPKGGPAPQVKLGKANKFTLKNGLTVIMVENHKLPRAAATLRIDNPPKTEGAKAGLSSMMGSLLGRGTPNITKDEFNDRVDFLGASVSFGSSSAFASSLTKFFPEVLGLMADGVKNAVFTQEEFNKEVKITLDALKVDEKTVTSTARRVEDVLAFGKSHPYGEFTSKESVNSITLNDVKKEYSTFYKPNNAYLIIIGDINPKKTKKLVKNLFQDWKAGSIPNSNLPKVSNVETTEINFVDMPNAVQSEVTVLNTIDLTLGDDDYFAALLANQILGGGGTARLFMNLREDKGYTYGAYSNVSQSRYVGNFRASASVRNIVTDSAVVEMMKEINKIRYQKPTAEELENAKQKYIGSFVMNAQNPTTAATFAFNKEIYNLPDDYYETYLAKINSVTLDDVQNAAIKYFKGDKARIVVTGKALDVIPNLEKNENYKISYFDKYGNPTQKPELTLPIPQGMTAINVVDNYFKAIGGLEKVNKVKTLVMVANANVQGTPILLTRKVASPNKTSQVISVMGNVMQKNIFDGKKGYQEARGQKAETQGKELEAAKNNTEPFNDLEYKNGILDRIEPIDGKKYYVIRHKETEVFYSVETGLKTQTVRTVQTPNGEVKVPTNYSNYKEVEGILFPFQIDQKMGPMDIKFEVSEIKVNQDVTDKDFE